MPRDGADLWDFVAGLDQASLMALLAHCASLTVNAVCPPVLRLVVALVFAAPAAVAGFALVHGITREPCRPRSGRMMFWLIGGGVTGLAALMRLAAVVVGNRD